MSIRRPQDMSDIEQMVDLGAVMAGEGAYAGIQYSHDKTRLLGTRILEDMDEHLYFARVCMYKDRAVGMLIGYLSEYYFSHQLIAQDMLLYMHPDHRRGSAAVRMVKQFVEWAKERKAAEVCMGITAGINNDTAARLYEALGFNRTGYIYKMRTL